MKLIMQILILLAVWGCKQAKQNLRTNPFTNIVDEDLEGKDKIKNPLGITQHTVAIIDDGFDDSHQVFKDKIVGKYTYSCAEATKPQNSPKTFDEMKDQVLKDIKATTNCTLKEGIEFSAGEDIKSLSQYRDTWNQGILSKSGVALNRDLYTAIQGAVSGENLKKSYHGTAVAGLIAYKNKNTKFVFIQTELASPGEDVTDAAGFSCPTQSDLNLTSRVFKDPEVVKAFVEKPLDESEKKLIEISMLHKITLVNKSYGVRPRAVIEKNLKEKCGLLDFKALFEAQGLLDEKRKKWLSENNPMPLDQYTVTVQAAGNDNTNINNFGDSIQCGGQRNSAYILVGAYDDKKNRSSFSNYGNCVDYYTLGTKVVVAAPGGFLNVVDGTSFAAPLMVRFLSLNTPPGEKNSGIISLLDNSSDSKGHMSSNSYPTEIAFDNKNEQIGSYALTSNSFVSSSLLGALTNNILYSKFPIVRKTTK